MAENATIFAVSSGAPPAAIAVLRISGLGAISAATSLVSTLPPPRRASLRRLRDPRSGEVLDSALVLVFPGPDTATGEDLVELHLHGGRAVVAAVQRVLGAIGGLRLAEPGEFTRRALAAGRIDLTEAEGLGDLLAAETEGQRRAAMTGADGTIRRRIDGWATRLLNLSARVEAELDFSDEDDVSPVAMDSVTQEIRTIADDMRSVLSQPPIERLRTGISVVLGGPPNSGKSTLLNALAERDLAIVSPIAGTTRDRIDVPVSREGVAYLLTDTAGLAETTDDPIEAIGIDRARRAMETADILVWLGDDPPPLDALWVHARMDLQGRETMPPGPSIGVSIARDQGVTEVWEQIAAIGATLLPRENEVILNERQRGLVETARAILAECDETDALLIAETLRSALVPLHRITGSSDTEAMLDGLFGAFCIGK